MLLEEQDLVEETENTEQQAVEQNVENTEAVNNNTEDVAQSTEDVDVLKYSDKDLNEIIAKRIARQENKIRKEYDRKYSKLENVLSSALGTSGVEEATEKLTDFYKRRGVEIKDNVEELNLSDRQIEILANAEAQEIIDYGYDAIVEEVDDLANIGIDNMSKKEKLIFTKLAEKRRYIEDEKDLSKLGVSRDVMEDKDFIEYSKKLNPSLSTKEKYEMFLEARPKKNIKPIGSMTSNQSNIKREYTAEEIGRLTEEELDDPVVWEAVRKFMTGEA